VFQHADQQLFARTVIDEVAFAPVQAGRSKTAARSIAFQALLDLGLESRADFHPYDLSPAERKLVAFAAALAQEPRLLILDEPTQGLDARSRDRVCERLLQLAREKVAVLLVSHDLGVVAEVAHRAAVLERGQVVADLPARTLVTDANRVRALGLGVPPAAALSLALELPGTPIRRAEVVQALVRLGTPDGSARGGGRN
jgi:energy-coupling factor transporter ATP-binding protein EcfA2